MSELTQCPPHLAGQNVLLTATAYSIRPAPPTVAAWPTPLPIEEFWERLTEQQRRDLYQISLITTQGLEDSSSIACHVGDFRLYEDDEIRISQHLLEAKP